MEEKQCKDCGEWKSLSNFRKQTRTKGGYSHRCKDCQRPHDKRNKERNKEKIKSSAKTYYARKMQEQGKKPRKLLYASLDLDRLRECCDQGMSIRAIAACFGVGKTTIYNAIEYAGIERGSYIPEPNKMGPFKYSRIDPKAIKQYYLEEEMSLHQTAKSLEIDISTLQKSMDLAGIPKRKYTPPKPSSKIKQDRISEEDLRSYYIDKELTVRQIATIVGTSHETVSKLLQKFKIPTRRHTPEEGLAGLQTLYTVYQLGAKRRGYTFDLTLDQFKMLTSQNCYYCGCPPSQKNEGPYLYNGIDRTDSTKGYLMNNVKSCCGRCNMAKGRYTEEQFLKWIDRLVAFRLQQKQIEK